jgi:hypothetical protein
MLYRPLTFILFLRKDISSDKKKIMVDEVLKVIAGHGHEVYSTCTVYCTINV